MKTNRLAKLLAKFSSISLELGVFYLLPWFLHFPVQISQFQDLLENFLNKPLLV